MPDKLTAVNSTLANHLIECNNAFYRFCAAASALKPNHNKEALHQMELKRARLLELLLKTEKAV